jgi:hypothetical protein
MIRATCAWALVLLSASPFTAPFSTCDLGAFLSATKSAQLLPLKQSSLRLAAKLETSDADALSPVVARVQLDKETALTSSGFFVVRRINQRGFKRVPRDDVNRRPHDLSTQPTILRV